MNRRLNRNLSVEEAVAVVTFAETGLSQRYVGHRLGVNQSTVSRVLKRHRELKNTQDDLGKGESEPQLLPKIVF
jgi:IS30 family transposase